MKNKLDKQKFIEKANLIHNNKYDYSLIIFENGWTKVCIICPDHGEFWQRPYDHLRGYGCKKCMGNKLKLLNKSNKNEFIEKAISIHGNKYGYDNFIYKDSQTKGSITCFKNGHGDYFQAPNAHLSGKGCPKCYHETVGTRCISNINSFIEKARAIHGNKYDYSLFNYTGNKNKSKIKCNTCSCIFDQTPDSHLRGRGCPRCKRSKGELALEAIFEKHNIEFKSQFMLPYHGYKYDFYLPSYNLLIEFHGKQHYEPVEAFGGEEEFKNILFRDACKRSLAWDNKIPLLEIHYKYLKIMNEVDFETFILNKITGFLIFKQLSKN